MEFSEREIPLVGQILWEEQIVDESLEEISQRRHMYSRYFYLTIYESTSISTTLVWSTNLLLFIFYFLFRFPSNLPVIKSVQLYIEMVCTLVYHIKMLPASAS